MAQANLEALGDFDLQTTKSQIGSGQIDSLLNSMLARCLRRESAGWGGGDKQSSSGTQNKEQQRNQQWEGENSHPRACRPGRTWI